MVAGVATPDDRAAVGIEEQAPTRRTPARGPNRRRRRLAAGTLVATGLLAAFVYMFLALIEAERGNPFRGWFMYVFCGAAFALAAAGTVADNIRVSKRAHTPTGTPSDGARTARQPAAHSQAPTGTPLDGAHPNTTR